MYGRWSFWPAIASRISGAAMLTGIEKPMPLASWAMAVLIPITAPAAFRSGPPLLPGLIAASVWIRLWSVPPSVWIWRPTADTMPLVTLFEKVPSGLPIATTSSPTLSASESPSVAAGSPVASIFTIARSVRVSMP